MSNITSNKCPEDTVYLAKIPPSLIGSGMIRKCKVKTYSLCKVEKCEEGAISGRGRYRGKGDLIKIEEINRKERDMFLEEMSFQFAPGDCG